MYLSIYVVELLPSVVYRSVLSCGDLVSAHADPPDDNLTGEKAEEHEKMKATRTAVVFILVALGVPSLQAAHHAVCIDGWMDGWVGRSIVIANPARFLFALCLTTSILLSGA